MNKYAIYGRYSTEMQNEKSVEDQVRECQKYIDANNGATYEIYADRAMSGASRFRPNYQKMLNDATEGKFQFIIAEALDRLSRDQEDLASLYKHFVFHDVSLLTLSEGIINELHVGLKGTMNALFLKDLARKTRRGLEGRVRAGKSAGGKTYGYNIVKDFDHNGAPITGQMEINQFEAQIIQRIFIEFSEGKSPRKIAKDLNNENVPGPHGKTWTDTVIRGHKKKGTGILNNERYIGRIIWNRQRFIKNPQTGKRISRLNPPKEWIIQENLELALLSENLWKSVKARQDIIAETAPVKCGKNYLTGSRRSKFLLSGLLKCGECGGGYTIVSQDRYGCANRKNRGSCHNSKTIKRQDIEKRVLSGLKNKLLEPKALTTFIDQYVAQLKKLEKANESEQRGIKQELKKIDKRLNAILHAIEQGIITNTTQNRILELETQKLKLSANLEEEFCHPKPDKEMINLYQEKVKDLSTAIYEPEIRNAAMDALRPLIDRIILKPTNLDDIKAELYGNIAAVVALDNEKGQNFSDLSIRLSVVAGVGFEPTTFRL
ncbi:MAG: recombinase family protein [Alphaproteobacteria bacterium]